MIPQRVSTLFFELADFWRHLRRAIGGSGVPGVVVATQIKYYLVSTTILLPYVLTDGLSQPFDVSGSEDAVFGIAPELDNIYGLSVEELPI